MANFKATSNKPKPVTQLGAQKQAPSTVKDNAWLSCAQANNNGRATANDDDNTWLLSKPKRPTDRHNQRLSGWHISSLPPESNISRVQTNPTHDLDHWSIFDQPHSTSSHANLESPTLDFLPNNRNDVSARAVSQSNAPNTHDTPSCSDSNSSYIDLIRAQEHRELIEAIKAPAIKPPIFTGDLIDYPRWKKAFNAFLGQHVHPSASDKPYYLDQYTSGQVGEVIQSYIYILILRLHL